MSADVVFMSTVTMLGTTVGIWTDVLIIMVTPMVSALEFVVEVTDAVKVLTGISTVSTSLGLEDTNDLTTTMTVLEFSLSSPVEDRFLCC